MTRVISIVLSLFTSFAWADLTIETIQINHRPAQDILAEVSAFLPETATARAFNNMIILKAEPATIEQTKQLINKLDTPPQRLKLTLLKTSTRLTEKQQSSWQSNVEIGDKGTSANLTIKQWSTHAGDNQNAQYQAQGMSGLPISLNIGQLIPQSQQNVILRFNGDVIVQNSTEYIPINNGFEAIAQLLPNNQVSIQIYPQFGQLSKRHGTIEHSQLITTISGPATTWLELAQIENNVTTERDGARHYQTHQHQNTYLYIKLDPLTY